MKGGAENRKKTIMAGALGAVALCCVVYMYFALFGGSSAPEPTPAAPVTTSSPAAKSTPSTPAASKPNNANSAKTAAIPGVDATRMASTSSSLDPTLDESAMLRTESLVYTGTGRNIFSLIYVPPPGPVVKNVPPARPAVPVVAAPTGPPPPPPPPPINLKFFGTAKRSSGTLQAFLLSGEDVYLASQGDIVVRKYKIVNIGANSIQVEDLSNSNTQTLPLQQ